MITVGCVRRTARFTSVPDGARVFLNDREIGRTPATVEFTWYGDYDVVYRLEGYETIKTNAVLNPPLYQRFPFDFFAEVLWPGDCNIGDLKERRESRPVEIASVRCWVCSTLKLKRFLLDFNFFGG